MKKILTLGLILFINMSFAQTQLFFEKADAFFKTYVSNGKVDYASIHKSPEKLNEILEIANKVSVSKDDANTYQAFWINAYNISVIKGIIDKYPTNSPLANPGFFDKTKHNIGGKKIILNDIENKLLRAQFDDARFHFVLVCGALGCPPLIDEAYLPNTLDAQLTRQTKLALNNPNFIKVKKNKVEVSEILKWYKGDFVKKGQSEIDFINKYRDQKIPAGHKLGYYSYNWTLNAK
ncbi:DUF547 domain-containing protein [Leptobacterium flavescens]|uniref:DUF547 domain-containing protein n=1 Tax=Leptobacterium flavescens TaxID=472055 RepID=A0A6P0UWE9_9FLAO|nr:DUF547 domain-containing protein [Leptobacterium flavescens]NER14756.1 DUF547 domain-containing protein [Leptobacterium flavescens]